MKPRIFGLVLLVFLSRGFLSGQRADSNSELQLGVASLDQGEYEKAVKYLEQAVAAAPESIDTHVYLARACAGLYVGSPSADYDDYKRPPLTCAIQEYNTALQLDAGNTEALNGLGYVYTTVKDWNRAESCYRRAIEADPHNFEALYTLGTVLWVQVSKDRLEARESLRIGNRDKLIDRSSCVELRAKNLGRIDEALSLFKTALRNRDSSHAMGYVSRLYRERAELDCRDKSAYERDIAAAHDWELGACAAKDTTLPERCPPGPPLSSVRGCPRPTRR